MYLTVERQQKIKEELYLYLLNKREENGLTLAITESNARIIDPASGSSDPGSTQIDDNSFGIYCFGDSYSYRRFVAVERDGYESSYPQGVR